MNVVNKIKNNRITISIIVGLIIVSLIASYFMFFGKEAEAAWFDESWIYRQRVDITNSGSAQTDFQVAITFNTSALITAGKMQSDCDDIRVTDMNGKLLPHWIETGTNACNTTTTAIWTKAPSIPTSGATLYLYYGNLSATSTQNGNNAFIYFDDFSGYSLGALPTGGKWTWESSVVSPTIVDDSGARSLRLVPQSSGEGPMLFNQGTVTNTTIHARMRDANNAHYHIGRHSSLSSPVGDTGQGFWVYPANINLYLNNAGYDSWSSISSAARSISLTTYHTYKVTANGSSWEIYEDGAGSPTHSGTEGTYSSGYPTLMTYSGEDIYVDYFFVRTFAATEPTVGSPTNEEIGPGPVAYWKFDEGYGTTLNDSTLNSINLTRYDGDSGSSDGNTPPTWDDKSISGKTLMFDGYDDYASGNSSKLDFSSSESFTVSAWINSKDWHSGDQANPVVQKYGWGPHDGWVLGIRSGGQFGMNLYSRTIMGSEDQNRTATIASSNISLNQWHHVVGVVDQSADYIYFYLDGVLKTSTSISGWTTAGTSGFNLIIGHNGSAISGWGYAAFQGQIDEAKVYPYARSAAEIKADYDARGTSKGTAAAFGSSSDKWLSDGLVGYWKMDDSGATAIDSSGNGHDGSVTSATVTDGVYGNGKNFDGIDDIITISSQPTFTSEVTVSAWVYWSAGNSAWGLIGSPCEEPWYSWGLRPHQFVVRTSSNPGSLTTAGDSIVYDEWEFLTGTYDGSYVKFYRNGQLIQSTSGTGSISYSGSYNVIDMGGWRSNADHWMDGKIDQVRIYNRVLSPKEVRDLYNRAPGPVAYYNFDENTGTSTVYDRSGNGNDGTMNGSMTESDWVPGKFGSALDFDGDNDYVNIGDIEILDLAGNGTIGAWVKIPSVWEGDTYPNLVSKGATAGWDTAGWSLHAFSTNSIGIGMRNGATTNTVSFTNSIKDQWTYIAGSWDGTTIKIYQDGVLKNSTAQTIAPELNTTSVLIGQDANGQSFDGFVDDVRIYNYAQTAKQIVEDMNAGHPAVGSPVGSAVGYWKFDEGYGTTSNDSGFGGNNGTITGASWTNQGKFGKALNFNGSSSYINCGNNSSLNMGTGSFTHSAWIKAPEGTTNRNIIDKGIGTTAYGFRLGTDGKVYVDIRGGGTIGTASTIRVDDDSWHYISVVLDKSSDLVKIYIDGVLNNTGDASAIGDTDNSNNFFIGADNGNQYWFDGLIDEVKIYNFALAEDEIRLDYNAGSALNFGTGIEEDTSDNPVGYWKLDENSGSTAYDSGSGGNNGTITGATAVSGRINGARNFSGTNDKVQTSDPIITGTGDFTIEAWINSSVSSSTDYIAGNYGADSCLDGVEFYTTTSNTLRVYISGSVSSTGTFNTNTWYHVAVTRSSGSIKLYINGAQDGSGTLSSSIGGNCNLAIGNGPNYTSERFEGKIDEVKAYNYARSAQQIKADAATDVRNPVRAGAPVGEWKMDEKTGTTANDTSGNGNTGTLQNMEASDWKSAGECHSGSCLDFDGGGSDEYVDTGYKIPAGARSYFLWIKYDGLTGPGGYSLTGTQEVGAYTYIGIQDGGQGYFYAGDSGGTFNYTFTTDVWYHVGFTMDGSSATKLYVNGRQVDTKTYSSDATATVNFLIGKASQGHQINGKIDHVKIYDYARTQAQIAWDYNRGKPAGWWKFDECQGGTAYDASGNSNNGIITIGGTGSQDDLGTCTDEDSTHAWYNGVDGKYSSSLNFDGTDDYVNLGSKAVLEFTDSEPWSFSHWIRWAGQSLGYVFYAGKNATVEGFLLRYSNQNRFGFRDKSGGYHLFDVDSSTPYIGAWTHLVWVADGSGNLSLYVNGVLLGTKTSVPTQLHLDSIGRGYNPSTYNFEGLFDDVRIYNYALTANQMKTLFNEGSAVRFGL